MRIHLKLYSNLKTYAPGRESQFDLTLLPGATLKTVCSRLGIPAVPAYTALINGRRLEPDTPLNPNDTLVIFPEICGG